MPRGTKAIVPKMQAPSLHFLHICTLVERPSRHNIRKPGLRLQIDLSSAYVCNCVHGKFANVSRRVGDVCAHIDFLNFIIIFIIYSSYANSLNNSRQISFLSTLFSYISFLIIFELSGCYGYSLSILGGKRGDTRCATYLIIQPVFKV
jgi:hypothetical protein